MAHERRHRSGHRRRDSQPFHSAPRTGKKSVSSSFFKITPLYDVSESGRKGQKNGKYNSDVLFTNGTVLAVRVEAPKHMKCIRLQRLYAPLKKDYAIEEYCPKKRPPTPYAVARGSSANAVPFCRQTSGRRQSGGERRSGKKEDLTASADSSLASMTSREKAIAMRLNNIICQMESGMRVNAEDPTFCGEATLEGDQTSKTETNGQPTWLEIKGTLKVECDESTNDLQMLLDTVQKV